MILDSFKFGLLVLAAVVSSFPTARAGETLDEAALAAELSKMGCQVEIKMLAGSLTVERVETHKKLSDDLFVRLNGLRQLVALDLRLPSEYSGSACLRELVPLCTLRELALSGAEVNDQAAQYVGGLTNLESLKLHSVSVSEGGLLHLANLKKLRHLEVSSLKPITSKGLRVIATLTNLEEISIGGNCEKGALLVLKPLEKLTTISVGGTHIDDQLTELCALPSVRAVKIFRATITPATAGSLLAMHNLESLDLGCCDIEPEAARRMQSLHLKRLACYGASSTAYRQLLESLSPDLWDLRARSE